MPLEIVPGNGPLILALPYTGTSMRPELVERLHDKSQYIGSNDRYLDRLVGDLATAATTLRTNFHRFVSDVDTVLSGANGQPRNGMLGVIPLLDRDGSGIWDIPPTTNEARIWRALYFAPYHAALATQIARVRAKCGHAIVLNCRARHENSIHATHANPSDIAFSTHMGVTSGIGLSTELATIVMRTDAYSVSVNGHVQTGWTTRQYGRPKAGTHAFDLDISEKCYLSSDGETGHYDAQKAAPLRDILRDVMEHLSHWRPR